MEFFDTHCHLDFPDFDIDREQIINECDELGVKHILIPGVCASDWERVVETSALRDGYFPAFGLHPMFIERHQQSDVEKLEKYIQQHKPLAIGEIGLDFFVEGLDRNRQLEIFELQLDIANHYRLPVVLHIRKAHDEVLKLLRKKNIKGGFAHAFSGSRQQADQFIELGFKIGFGGAITYDRASKLRKLVAELPLGSFVLETDAPDLSPVSHHKQRNSPQYLPEIFSTLCQLRSESRVEINKALLMAARSVLNV